MSIDGKSWTATGLYYNDDGTVLNTTGNSNLYRLTLDGVVNAPQFTLTIKNLTTATNSANGGSCSAINQNDYIGSLYIYNAAGNNLDKINPYKVVATYELDGSTYEVGTATYDHVTQRIVFVAPTALKLCLSAISKIDFTQ